MSILRACLRATVGLCALTMVTSVCGQSFHEYPAHGDRVSGVGLLRGWSCDAQSVRFSIDGSEPVDAVYGLSRGDTRSRCNDDDNGYAFLVTWSLLERGTHNLVVEVDGQTIANLTFEVGGTGEPFLSDLEHRGITYGVPDADSFCTFQWQTAAQNLQLAECAPSLPSGPGSENLLGDRRITIESQRHGMQTYDAYVPSGYSPAQPMALVVALHGAGGSAPGVRNTWALVAEPAEFIVVAPRAAGQADVWEPGVDEFWVEEVISDISTRYNIEGSRVYLWGFSAGGHFAHALGLFGTDTYAAYAISAGTLGFAGTGAPAAAPRTIPVLLQVGDGDTVQRPFVMDDFARFQAAGWVDGLNVALDTFSGGHTYTVTSVTSAWRFMALRALPAN